LLAISGLEWDVWMGFLLSFEENRSWL